MTQGRRATHRLPGVRCGGAGPRRPGIGPADVRLVGRRLAPLAALLAVWSPPGAADGVEAGAARVLEEVVTTAAKRGAAEAARDIAGAVSVLDGERLAARHVTDIEDLSYALPNVAFDGIGTGKGIANFSIRGAGVAGSIPSIDPTVGVFVDGMYLGVNYGVIMDLMDLEAIEVLRGPQGLLFGRNVTGGAVLLRARRASGGQAADATVRLETGPEKRASGAVEGAFAKRGGGCACGGELPRRRRLVRQRRAPAAARWAWRLRRRCARWSPSGPPTILTSRSSSNAGSPTATVRPTQNRYRYGNFDFAIDEPGFSRVDWRHAVIEANRRLGGGMVTNVFGARTVRHESLADIDSTTDPVFHPVSVHRPGTAQQ